MATTATLETSYWWGRKESRRQTRAGWEVTRLYRVPRAEYANLVPAMGDTASDRTTLVVTAAERAGVIGPAYEWMSVTYLERTASGSAL